MTKRILTFRQFKVINNKLIGKIKMIQFKRYLDKVKESLSYWTNDKSPVKWVGGGVHYNAPIEMIIRTIII